MVSSTTINETTELNLLTLPLTGRSLIEASAGTGKTYSLALIYLRLLLGIGENSYPKALSVEEILVVTFTKAATEELRFRISQNIHQLRKACIQGYHDDPNYQSLLDLIKDKSAAAKRLYYAEQNMDQAAIFTIHSFCQRLLTTYAFEAGSLFNKTLLKDEKHLILQQVQNFWREYFVPLSKDLAQVVWQNWADPQALLDDIYPYLYRELPENVHLSSLPMIDVISNFHRDNIVLIESLKQQWSTYVNDIQLVINQSGVNKRSYSKSNLKRWVDNINQWSQTETIDYSLPISDLKKFSQTELLHKTDDGKEPPLHPFFDQVDQIVAHSFSLKEAILFDVVNIINQYTQQEKNRLAQMGFDDLLNDLKQALFSKNGDFLVKQVISQFPVAMIDEFQDTDPIQYKIFDRIYHDSKTSLLLFIGDPKQAIYSFRGADIFTYIKAKLSVDHRFTMTTNWRSIPEMVKAVNEIFSLKKNPFIFEQIPFVTMKSAEENQNKGFYIHNEKVEALRCYLLPESVSSTNDYLEFAAQTCAEQIAQWLTTESYIYNKQGESHNISSADIAILVRTGREAEIMRQSLTKRNIKSVYVSNHRSVFESIEAKEVLRILQAVIVPTDEMALRSALATRLIGATMAEIDHLSIDQQALENLVDEFNEYQVIWYRYGVLVMLRRLMNRRSLAENWLAMAEGERIITNFMHLSELLQEISQELDTPHALIRWLIKQINEPNSNATNHEQRLESDKNLINIITIHKSKGLEYPIVFLPFIGHYRESNSSVYHDEKTYSTYYAHDKTSSIKKIIEQERLAEDLRLLYVALTRSIYHCSFVLAGLKKGRSKDLSINKSAIGHLLLMETDNDYDSFQQRLVQLSTLPVVNVELPIPITSLNIENELLDTLTANIFKRKLNSTWRVTSYSGLQQPTTSHQNRVNDFINNINPAFDSEVLSENDISLNNNLDDQQPDPVSLSSSQYDIHHFPKGAIVGTLLHECFENIDFMQPDFSTIISQLINKLNLTLDWQQSLVDWVTAVCSAPLQKGLSLSQISMQRRMNELQFFLPIRNLITAEKVDKICKKFDAISQQCPTLDFQTVQGMLKGYIDMVFEWKGKYYIVDYKSNYLGATANDYTQMAMNQAMCEHRYDLQYQLYTLALHRYLKTRISDYRYEKHFGGVYYLFIRGMSDNNSQNGIFYTKPSVELIENLDLLLG